MMKIYHNPRCRKSREGLKILEESNQKFEIIEYLKTPPSHNELKNIIDLLSIAPIELIRKNEAIWKEKYKNKSFTDAEIIDLMTENPKLIERPIVFTEDKAVIGRPPDNIRDMF